MNDEETRLLVATATMVLRLYEVLRLKADVEDDESTQALYELRDAVVSMEVSRRKKGEDV